MKTLWARVAGFVLLLVATPFATANPRPLTAQVTLSAHIAAKAQPAVDADYRLSRPVQKLDFSRTARGLREKMWTLDTPGIAFRDDSIVSTNNHPFSHFKFHVSPYTRLVNLNYAPAVVFADRSLALFTGYFNIAGDSPNTSFRFTNHDSPVLVYGQPVAGISAKIRFHNDGSFVYFGKLKPVKTQNSILILDPSLPQWIAKALTADIPDIIAFYSRQLHSNLPRRTFILFTWMDRQQQGGTSYKGDSLDDNISFTVSGAEWATADAENRESLARLIAHELAHQWNAHLFLPQDWTANGGNWLPEGQAEFSANQTAYHFGWLGKQDLLRNYTTDINNCLLAPDDKPVSQQNWNNNAIYGCGVTFNLLAEAALQKHVPKYSFFDLWHAIYTDAGRNHHQYSAATYLNNLRRMSGDAGLADAIDTVSTKSAIHKNQLLLSALQRLGVGFTRISAENADADTSQQAVTQLFVAMMKSDCRGSVSFYILHDGFRVDPIKGCRVLNQPYVINAIQGQPLFSKGFTAYQAVVSDCAKQLPIALTVAGHSAPVTLACPTVIPPMPEIVRLTSLPWLPTALAQTYVP